VEDQYEGSRAGGNSRVDQVRPISQDFRRQSNVLMPVSRGDLQSSIAESLFDIVLPSGEVVQLLGAKICQVDHISGLGILR
jgi:hypothetical protein